MTAALNPRHHPACRELCAFAEGRSNEAARLFISAHLSLCPACRLRLQDYEAKAGINLEDMPPENMDAACLENLLLKIDEHGPPACIDVTIPVQASIATTFIPEALQEYVGVQLDEFMWREDARGVFTYHQRHIALQLPPGLRLLRFKAGTKIKLKASVHLLVLEGEIRTLFGTYHAGDVLKGGIFSAPGAEALLETLALAI